MALAIVLRPVFVFAASVQHYEIVEKLDITPLKVDIERAFLNRLPIDFDRFLLRRREFRYARQVLRLVDDGADACRAEIAVREREDRLLEIGPIARAHLAAA